MSYPKTPGFVASSDTSEEAAASMIGCSSLYQRMVFQFIAACDEGATCDEAEEKLGLAHQSCSARIRELVLDGRLVDTGDRRMTRSGRNARVYRVVYQARQ